MVCANALRSEVTWDEWEVCSITRNLWPAVERGGKDRKLFFLGEERDKSVNLVGNRQMSHLSTYCVYDRLAGLVYGRVIKMTPTATKSKCFSIPLVYKRKVIAENRILQYKYLKNSLALFSNSLKNIMKNLFIAV